MSDQAIDPYKLPPDLEAWGWRMSQMKSGPRKHPGGWHQFIFRRLHGLAEGDVELDFQDESLRVKVRLPGHAEAFAEAIRLMRERSTSLTRSDNYQRLLNEDYRRWEDLRARAAAYRAEHGH